MSVADLPSIAEELALMRGADKSVKRTYSGSKAKVGGVSVGLSDWFYVGHVVS